MEFCWGDYYHDRGYSMNTADFEKSKKILQNPTPDIITSSQIHVMLTKLRNLYFSLLVDEGLYTWEDKRPKGNGVIDIVYDSVNDLYSLFVILKSVERDKA